MLTIAALYPIDLQWACQRILGLPVIIRTLLSLRHAGVHEIHLPKESEKHLIDLLKDYRLSGYIQFLDPQVIESYRGQKIVLPGYYHYDPQFIRWMVQKGETDFKHALSQVPLEWWDDLTKGVKSLSRSSHKLFKVIRQNTEGWIAPYLNKPVSFALTRVLVQTGISPNQITFFNIFLAFLAAVCLSQPLYEWWVAGALLMQLSSIMDGCDGEVAKLKFQFSKQGAWLDTLADDICNNLFFIGLFIGLYRTSGENLYWQIGSAVFVMSLGVSFFIYHGLIREGKSANAKDFKPAWKNRSWYSSLFDFVRPIMKRDFFVFVMMVMILLNQRHWLFVMGILTTLITFLVYMTSFLMLFFHKNSQ